MTIAAKQCREWIEANYPDAPISRFACRNTASGGVSQHSAYGSPSSPIDSNALDIFGPGKTSGDADQAYIDRIVYDLLQVQDEWSIRKILWRDGGAHENHAHVDFYPMIQDKMWCGKDWIPTWQYSDGGTVDTRDPEPENGRYGGPTMGMELDDYRAEHNVTNPPQWALNQWEKYVAAGGSSVPESIGWPYSRFDIADFWAKFVDPLQRQVAELEQRLRDVEGG